MEIRMRAGAKINLSLDVLSKREDGYHEVEMIMQEIELSDDVYIRNTGMKNGISLKVQGDRNVPGDERNTAFKAASLIKEKYGIEEGISISIVKNIPSEAGLAGGSSDAAAVIKGMDELFNLNMSLEEMMVIGKKVGADVPFCIIGKTAVARGIGEILTPLSSFSGVNIVVAKPDFGVSTPLIYKILDATKIDVHPDNDLLIKCIEKRDIKGIGTNMFNVLQPVTEKLHGEIHLMISILRDAGAYGAMMSGSGPSVFGIFEDEEGAHKGYEALEGVAKYRFITTTV